MCRHYGYSNIGHGYHDVLNVDLLKEVLIYHIWGSKLDKSLVNIVSGLMQYLGFYLNDGIWLLYVDSKPRQQSF